MITQGEFDELQKEVLERAHEMQFDDFHLTLHDAYKKAVEEIAEERNLPLRTFKDPINGDLYIAIGEGDID